MINPLLLLLQFRYLATEFCMGTLQDLVTGGYEGFAMTDTSHLPILVQIARGIDYLHQLGIVHGNLKPTNVLVSFPNEEKDQREPMIKLADFGLLHRDTIVFTEGWMCPFDSRDPVAPSFDIFPLGCVFGFTVSKGTHPFGTNPITAFSNRQPMTLTLDQIESGVRNEVFLNLINRMVHYDAGRRPSAFEILAFVFHSEQQQIEQQQETTPDLVIPHPQPPSSNSAATASILVDAPLHLGDR